MQFAVSNIAWSADNEASAFEMLSSNGVTGIEVAPTKLWPGWHGVNAASALAYKHKYESLGFQIPAMQAILFGRPELQVFNRACHAEFLEHIAMLAETAANLGAKVMVFGSPKNRKRNSLAHVESVQLAVDFFGQAGEICAQHDCAIGLEHNPVEYGCDFATNIADAARLVALVDSPGFVLHMDSAGIHMCEGDLVNSINSYQFSHYHISEPMLDPVMGDRVGHRAGLLALAGKNYENWVSIEMKEPESFEALETSVVMVKEYLQGVKV